ncbi:lysophospholipid acyltransferase family protein [Geobacter sp. AOG1]|uniref:lysophospholipid acyltransferase family protein n=1 Tax=Geobacter sp. AOG1 TaxID=1566346 RepID=UPI001CC63027|nr:lysophospholipid acyltransferase family protein [Geobacter sp. AOG1]GFE58116.1 lipoprotein [Geobacter sp. AOG1]
MRELRRKIARSLSGRPLTLLMYGIIRLLRATMRICIVGDAIDNAVRTREGFVGVFWHGRMLMLPFLYPGNTLYVLISVHRDGEIIANIMKCFGFRLVRGSSSKGGKAALQEMVRLLRAGNDVAVTPDGPRGPSEELKPGVAQVARLSGRPVIPIAFSASSVWRMKSWDRFLIPRPFSRGVFVVGEPLHYREGEDMEVFRLRIEHALKEATGRADGYFRT